MSSGDIFVFECPNCDYESSQNSKRMNNMVMRLHKKKCTMVGRTKDGEVQDRVDKVHSMINSLANSMNRSGRMVLTKEHFEQNKDGQFSSHIDDETLDLL